MQKTTLAEPWRSFFTKTLDPTALKINVTKETGVTVLFKRGHMAKRNIYLKLQLEMNYSSNLVLPEKVKAFLVWTKLIRTSFMSSKQCCCTTTCLSNFRRRGKPHILTADDFCFNSGNLQLRSFECSAFFHFL